MKFFSKKTFFASLLIAFFIAAFTAQAQEDKSERASPPAEASAEIGDTRVVIDYSQPAVNGREVFGELVPYNEVWRTGANEATTFEVDKDVLVEGQPLPAGKYALFTIPGEEEWTLIFNKTAEQWGSYEYDESQDALRVNVEPSRAPQQSERLTFEVDDSGEVSLMWDDTQVDFKMEEQE